MDGVTVFIGECECSSLILCSSLISLFFMA